MSLRTARDTRLAHAVASLLAVAPPTLAGDVPAGGAPVQESAALAGPKWPTDSALRDGMAAIRKATLDSHTLVTHRRMPPDAARRFAAAIKAEVEHIRAATKLPPPALEALEPLLAAIIENAEAVAGRSAVLTPIDGILGIDEALARYPQQFDDREWKPLR